MKKSLSEEMKLRESGMKQRVKLGSPAHLIISSGPAPFVRGDSKIVFLLFLQTVQEGKHNQQCDSYCP